MTMKSWHFSTKESAIERRSVIWQEAMNTVCLPMAAASIDEGFQGEVVGMVSPTGIEFSRVRATPLTISGSYRNQQAALWLALLLDGQSMFTEAGERIEIGRGDILYGPSGRDSTLELQADFRLLYIRVPLTLLHPALVDRSMLRFGILPGESRITRVLAGMLEAVGDELEDFDASEIHPVEVALCEFLVAGLSGAHANGRFGNTTRAAHFIRICQSIDQQLGDADLTMNQIADQHRVSTRYLQKLFEDAGLSFSSYLRNCRLERCRSDLVSPSHRSLSVSAICFRWGFNDAAHFSRSFRARFDMTPRECRNGGGLGAKRELDINLRG